MSTTVPSCREIPLTKGLVALVDSDLYPILSQYRWHTMHGYAVRMEKRRKGEKRTTIYMHHEVLRLRGIEVPADLEPDHRNRQRTDNRSDNLRVVTHGANLDNRSPLQRNNTSGFRGVSWKKRHAVWGAQITVNGKARHLGCFATAEDASAAYEAARRALGYRS